MLHTHRSTDLGPGPLVPRRRRAGSRSNPGPQRALRIRCPDASPVRVLAAGQGRQGSGAPLLGKVSGLSRAQLTRLIAQHRLDRAPARPPRPTAAALPPALQPVGTSACLAPGRCPARTLSGPATRKLCERAYTVFHDPRFERLAGISNGHLYNLRHSTTYQRQRGKVEPTRPTKVSIGERRRPHPEGRPGVRAGRYGPPGGLRPRQGPVPSQSGR